LSNSTIAERQQALTSLGKIDHPAAVKLLDEWLDGLISGNLEPAVQLDLIMAVRNSPSAELKSKLNSFEQNRADAPVLDRYQETLFGGDANQGRGLFFQDNSAQCIRCHRLGEFGGEVGPDLNGIASVLSREDLLKAMIDPSARLAPGYGTVSVTLKDGEQLVGVLEMETTDSLSVRTADGAYSVLDQDQLQNKRYIPSSMPTMESTLSKAEIRDLVAFLVEQKEQSWPASFLKPRAPAPQGTL
jgi:putative heme-binding domain-containing protein